MKKSVIPVDVSNYTLWGEVGVHKVMMQVKKGWGTDLPDGYVVSPCML